MCSERVEIIPNVWCGANFVEADMSMMLSLFVAGAVLCVGFESVLQCDSRVRRREPVRFPGVTEVTFPGRRSTLCSLDMWMETRFVSGDREL